MEDGIKVETKEDQIVLLLSLGKDDNKLGNLLSFLFLTTLCPLGHHPRWRSVGAREPRVVDTRYGVPTRVPCLPYLETRSKLER